jgi:hypothetical protein
MSTQECFRQRRRKLSGNKIGKVAMERQARDHIQSALLIVLYCMLFIQTDHQDHCAAIKSGYSILLFLDISKRGFDYSAGFVKPNMVPYDKFKLESIAKAYEYITTILMLDPERLIFADEKLIKGQELFNRLVRRDPI